jgi:hypothetical protein
VVLDCGEIGSVEDADRPSPVNWDMGRWSVTRGGRPASFPRRRESRIVWVWAVGREAVGRREGEHWIPACAGMTGVGWCRSWGLPEERALGAALAAGRVTRPAGRRSRCPGCRTPRSARPEQLRRCIRHGTEDGLAADHHQLVRVGDRGGSADQVFKFAALHGGRCSSRS